MTKKTVRKIVQDESQRLDWQYIRLHQGKVQTEALEEFGIDSFGALAVSSLNFQLLLFTVRNCCRCY